MIEDPIATRKRVVFVGDPEVDLRKARFAAEFAAAYRKLYLRGSGEEPDADTDVSGQLLRSPALERIVRDCFGQTLELDQVEPVALAALQRVLRECLGLAGSPGDFYRMAKAMLREILRSKIQPKGPYRGTRQAIQGAFALKVAKHKLGWQRQRPGRAKSTLGEPIPGTQQAEIKPMVARPRPPEPKPDQPAGFSIKYLPRPGVKPPFGGSA